MLFPVVFSSFFSKIQKVGKNTAIFVLIEELHDGNELFGKKNKKKKGS